MPIGSQRATAEAWRSGHIAVITGVGPAGWAAGRGRLVEAELLLSGAFADPAARAGADAGRGTVADAGLRVCGWFHAVLLPQAGRVSSRGRDTLV